MSALPLLSLAQVATLALEDTVIITANSRLALWVRTLWQQVRQQAQPEQSVHALPLVLSYTDWWQRMGQAYAFVAPESPPVLDPIAQQWRWQQVLAQWPMPDNTIMAVPATADSLRKARLLQHEWGIHVQENEYTPEYEQFQQWQQAYLDQLPGWDTVQQQQAVVQALKAGQLPLPRHMLWVGFYLMDALQHELIAIAQAQGVQVAKLQFESPAVQCQLFCAPNHDAEYVAALQWARRTLLAHPQQRLAIVVPNLQHERAKVLRLLRTYFVGEGLPHWHVAAGRRLSDWPQVQSVLQWLGLLVQFQHGAVPVATLGAALLQAQFAFGPERCAQLAMWDAELRHQGVLSVSRQTFLDKFLQWGDDGAYAVFSRTLVAWQQARGTPSQWAQRYRQWLADCHFSGQPPLDSVQYQLRQSFMKALHAFSALDMGIGDLNATQALQLFRQVLGNRTFQPQRLPQVGLDIVGLFETEGAQWDQVWALGLHDKVLPKATTPNPFIPIRSQLRCQVSGVSPETSVQWGALLFQSLRQCTPQLHLSWPAMQQEEILRPSAFLAPLLPQAQPLPLEAPAQPALEGALEHIADDTGLPKQGMVKGGYRFLELQSLNPLWAYAEYRLHLKPLPDYAKTAVTAQRLGQFYHQVAEHFYDHMRSQADLADDAQVTQQLQQAVQKASDEQLSPIASVKLKALLAQRCVGIFQRFIASERHREPFQVLACEQRLSFQSQGLVFSFTLDRCDQVQWGEQSYQVVIDYKTGLLKASSYYMKQWVAEPRLKDLQLPLYTQALPLHESYAPAIAGVLFGNLHREGEAYRGMVSAPFYSDSSGVVTVDSQQWSGYRQQWGQHLEQLCADIAQGYAPNRSVYSSDLDYCGVKPFLRFFQDSDDETGV